MNIAESYERVNGVQQIAPITKLTFPEAEKAVRKMYRHLTGNVFPYIVVETSGNRYTWLRGVEFRVNCEKGWEDLLHLFSHWYHRKSGGRPHSKRHARLELKLRKRAIKLGWMTGSLRQAEAKPAAAVDRVSQREAHARKMVERWAKKLKTAQRQLKKWSRKESYYVKKSVAAAAAPAGVGA